MLPDFLDLDRDNGPLRYCREVISGNRPLTFESNAEIAYGLLHTFFAQIKEKVC